MTELQETLSASVYPLADSLTMPLRLHHLLLKVTGQTEMELPLNAGAKKECVLMLTPKVIASFVNKHEAAVLLKVRKRLWTMAHHLKEAKIVSVFVIDAATLDMHESNWSDGRLGKPSEAYELLKRGIKARFRRYTHEDKWTRLDNEKTHTLDCGYDKKSEQFSSGAVKKSAAS